jgi:hypothetical protein
MALDHLTGMAAANAPVEFTIRQGTNHDLLLRHISRLGGVWTVTINLDNMTMKDGAPVNRDGPQWSAIMHDVKGYIPAVTDAIDKVARMATRQSHTNPVQIVQHGNVLKFLDTEGTFSGSRSWEFAASDIKYKILNRLSTAVLLCGCESEKLHRPCTCAIVTIKNEAMGVPSAPAERVVRIYEHIFGLPPTTGSDLPNDVDDFVVLIDDSASESYHRHRITLGGVQYKREGGSWQVLHDPLTATKEIQPNFISHYVTLLPGHRPVPGTVTPGHIYIHEPDIDVYIHKTPTGTSTHGSHRPWPPGFDFINHKLTEIKYTAVEGEIAKVFTWVSYGVVSDESDSDIEFLDMPPPHFQDEGLAL